MLLTRSSESLELFRAREAKERIDFEMMPTNHKEGLTGEVRLRGTTSRFSFPENPWPKSTFENMRECGPET